MKIVIRRGHQYTGQDGAAEGLVKEIEVAEDYHNRLITKFQALGHEVLDVTPYEANRSLTNSLNYGINMANEWGADLFISCHVNNCYKKYEGEIGCEVVYCPGSAKGQDYATKVESELVKLGFKSRGAKADERNLSEIHKTNCTCIIVEPFFVEATKDVEVYNRVGGEGIANAIVAGITGKTIEASQPIHYIVCYNNEVDKRSALYLAEYLGCECIDNSNTPFNYEGYWPITIGGGEFTSYAKLSLKGEDRFKTMLAVAKYIDERR